MGGKPWNTDSHLVQARDLGKKRAFVEIKHLKKKTQKEKEKKTIHLHKYLQDLYNLTGNKKKT